MVRVNVVLVNGRSFELLFGGMNEAVKWELEHHSECNEFHVTRIKEADNGGEENTNGAGA